VPRTSHILFPALDAGSGGVYSELTTIRYAHVSVRAWHSPDLQSQACERLELVIFTQSHHTLFPGLDAGIFAYLFFASSRHRDETKRSETSIDQSKSIIKKTIKALDISNKIPGENIY